MILSFILLSFRTLLIRNRLFTIINVAGLAIGMACLLLVGLFIHDEYRFDRYHTNADRIYRIVLDYNSDGVNTPWAKTNASFGHYLQGAYPEIEQVVRIRKNPGTDLLSTGQTQFYEERIFFADSTLLRVFDIKLKKGNPARLLHELNSVVISESLARKYFGSSDAEGKTLRLNNQLDLKVTGVMEDMPVNSHFVSDAFITFSSLTTLLGEKRLQHWGQFDHYTYVLLARGAQPELVEEKFPELLKRHAPAWVSEKETFLLQPLTSIHLHSDRKDEITPNSQESYSHILGTIALAILLMASANFVKLSTAMQLSRSKTISIQKILGASRIQLIGYFWIESMLVCVIAWMASWILASLALPYFNITIGKQISLLDGGWIILPSFAVAAFLGFLSSIIPARQAQKSNIVEAGKLKAHPAGRSGLRTILTTTQFSISILLIIVTLTVTSQFSFLKSERPGFESERIVIIPVKDRSQNDRHRVMVRELTQLPDVEAVSFSSSTPGNNNSLTYSYSFPGTESKDRAMATFLVDENFFTLYHIDLKEGRFNQGEETDTLQDVLLNEAAVQSLGLDHPIGQRVTGKVKGKIVGVVENFSHTSLHASIEPVIMYAYIPTFRFVSVKLRPGNTPEQLASLGRKWQELYPGYPLEYSFLNDQINQMYKAEFQLSRAYTLFSIIAVLIAGIGLIALTTYFVTQKHKEISIRKVFGSSSLQVVMWLYSGYAKIILASILLSWSLGYYWMQRWLSSFSYKTELHPSYFLLPTFGMLLILIVTTGAQTYRAASINPIKNLREE
ncbi:MAG: ABC transporter permease [Cytophagales bacterium]|nr:ABC transporter permease [Cytophagales bacterium]